MVIYRTYGEVLQQIQIEKYTEFKISLEARESINSYVVKKNEPLCLSGLKSTEGMLPADARIWQIKPFRSILFVPL